MNIILIDKKCNNKKINKIVVFKLVIVVFKLVIGLKIVI